MSLGAKPKRFALEYLVDLNATQAAIRAGYSKKTAYSQGHDLLKKPEVVAEVERLADERAKRTQITADRVLVELADIALCTLYDLASWDAKGLTLKPSKDLDKRGRRSVQSIKSITGADGSVRLEIKQHDPLRALDMICKHLGMFQHLVKIEGSVNATIEIHVLRELIRTDPAAARSFLRLVHDDEASESDVQSGRAG